MMILLHRYVVRANWILGLRVGLILNRKPDRYWNKRRWVDIGWELTVHMLIADVRIRRLVETIKEVKEARSGTSEFSARP